MIELINTKDVHPSKRYQFWRDYTCNFELLLSAKRNLADDAPFSAEAYGTILSDMFLYTWKYSSQESHDIIQLDRTVQHLAQDGLDTYVLVFNAEMDAICIQDGIELYVPGRSFCLFTTQPYRVMNRSNSGGVLTMIPRYRLQGLLATPDFLGPRVIPADYGVARLLQVYVQSIPDLMKENIPAGGSELIALQYAALVAMAFEPSEEGLSLATPTLSEMRYKEIIHYMDTHLSDCELTAGKVAAANNISVSYLSRLFAEHETGFQRQLLLKRLNQAAKDLVNTEFSRLSITDIAFRNGFSSTSHFSRCFRERFKLSPREYRQQDMSIITS